MAPRYLAWGWMSLIATGFLWGQDQQQVDPPSRVARLNYVSGTVSFRPGSQEDWAAATLNYPLTTGDHLWSDQQAGAEMHIGPNALRIAGGTSFAILNLDDRAVQVSVSQGFINVRIRRLEQGDTFEIDTPNGAISLLDAGDYRIDVNSDANLTTVTVRAGAAEVNGGGQTFPVKAGQEVRFTGADQLNAEPRQIPAPDQWDQWCLDRNDRDNRAEQAVTRYVSNNMIGAEDLADNGEWRTDAGYGAYWVPRVPAGWAPYRAGHWAFVEPWGWTWIDDAPWGFAPFHYGRWAFVGGAWGWYPGAVVVRPVYAPALVAFVGGSGFSAAIGVGGAGVAAWVPLGPREVYRPYYRVSDVYVRNVNITHVRVTNINVTNVTYVNRTYVTAVRHDVFVGAHPVSTGFVRVPSGAYSRMERVDTVSYRPAREAYMGRRTEGMRVVTPPRTVLSRTVVVNRAPPVMAGRPAVAAYRPAPPVTRRMEFGSQGRYQPAMTTGTHYANPVTPRSPANYGNPGNVGSQNSGSRGNAGASVPSSNRNVGSSPNYGNRNTTVSPPSYGNRGNAGASVPSGNRNNVGSSPNYGNRNTTGPVQQHQNPQQQQTAPRQRSTVKPR